MMFFAHLFILKDSDCLQNLIICSFDHLRPLNQISLQSVYNLASNVVHRQTNKQAKATKSVPFFAKEVNTLEKSTQVHKDFYSCFYAAGCHAIFIQNIHSKSPLLLDFVLCITCNIFGNGINDCVRTSFTMAKALSYFVPS